MSENKDIFGLSITERAKQQGYTQAEADGLHDELMMMFIPASVESSDLVISYGSE